MRSVRLNEKGIPESIAERLVYLRRNVYMRIDDVAHRFNVNKSTVSRWEVKSYWDNIGESSFKKEILLKLAELYQTDFYWLLHGRKLDPRKSNDILVIDDDNTSTAIISMLIDSTFGGKFSVVTFANGTDALNWAETHTAAAVICDFRLPDINGDIIILKLREMVEYYLTPVYAITVHDELEIYQSLINAGATKVYLKPVNDKEMFKILNSI